MKLRSGPQRPVFDEDAFLWETDGAVSKERRDPELSEAEEVGLHLFEAVAFPASLLLEDPNERFARHLSDQNMLRALQSTQTAREVSSEDFASHYFEFSPDGGQVSLETNPKDSPALMRIAIENGRRTVLLARLIAMFGRVGSLTIKELNPFPMTEKLPPSQMGNRYFRLVTAAKTGCLHDVACLFVWAEPDGMADRVEVLTWPIEKQPPTQI